MFSSCTKAASIFCSSLDETCLIDGISDVIVVKHKSGELKATRFFACFGPYAVHLSDSNVEIFINKTLIPSVKFSLDKYGYIQPTTLESRHLQQLPLKLGKNKLEFKVEEMILEAEIYLYTDNDQILISDVDGTLTKDDFGGLYNNYMGNNYLHDGYHELINRVSENGYKVVWMTMRSLPMYEFSKRYIQKHVGVEGPLLMEPEEFFHAMKKELLKEAGNVKANIMKNIKSIYPPNVSPFIGGLGNRETDAIAYRHADIPYENIYIIDTKSEVHKLNEREHSLTYSELVKDVHRHFPNYNAPKVGYI